jgi:hypothetical protein
MVARSSTGQLAEGQYQDDETSDGIAGGSWCVVRWIAFN